MIYEQLIIAVQQSAAAAAKLLQSCLTLCDPIDSSPPGSPIPGILQARTLEWVAISFSNAWKWKVKVKSLSQVWLLATLWTAAYQAPLSMGFSRARVLEWSSAELFFWKTKHSKANFGITSVGSGSIIVTFREWRGSGRFLAPTRKGDDHRGAGGWQLTPADWHKEQSDSGASFGKRTLF